MPLLGLFTVAVTRSTFAGQKLAAGKTITRSTDHRGVASTRGQTLGRVSQGHSIEAGSSLCGFSDARTRRMARAQMNRGIINRLVLES